MTKKQAKKDSDCTIEEQVIKAIEARKKDLIDQLLDEGADIDYEVPATSLTPTQSPDPNSEEAENETLPYCKDNYVSVAVRKGFLDIVQYLVENEISYNVRLMDGSCLHIAVNNNNEDMLRYLLSLPDIDKNVRDLSGLTAVQLAIKNNNAKLATVLLENGLEFDFQERDPKTGHTIIFQSVIDGNVKLLECLLDLFQSPFQCDLNGRYLVYYTVLSKRKEIIEFLTKKEALSPSLINAEDSTGNSAVSICVEQKDWEALKILIKAGGQLETIYSFDGCTVLHRAVMKGDLETVTRLIQDFKVKVDLRDSEDNTALHIAVCLPNNNSSNNNSNNSNNTSVSIGAQRAEIIKLLVDKKADINAQNSTGNAPLHRCSLLGLREPVAFLLQQKQIDVNVRNKLMRTPLHEAASQGHRNIVQMLLDKNANIEAESATKETAIQLAISAKQLSTAMELIARRANVERPHEHYGSLLQQCIHCGYEKLADQIIKRGVDLTKRDHRHRSALHSAVLKSNLHIVREITLAHLLNQPTTVPCDLNAVEPVEGYTALMIACIQSDADIVEWLAINCCASVSAIDSNGMTALHHAAQQSNVRVVEILLEAHAEVEVMETTNGRTPLHLACELDNVEVARVLIERGAAHLDSTDTSGQFTPLHLAVVRNAVKCVALLTEKGASLDARDANNRTPYLLGAKHGVVECCQVLVKQFQVIQQRKLVEYSEMG